MRWPFRSRSRGYKTVPKPEKASVLDIGGRLVRARARKLADRRRCERESGIADFEAVMGVYGAQIASGKRVNAREFEAALKPQMSKVRDLEDRLLLAALEPADRGAPLTLAWLRTLTEREFELVKWEEKTQNPGLLNPVLVITEAVAQRFRIEERDVLRKTIEACLDGTVETRFFGGPPKAARTG